METCNCNSPKITRIPWYKRGAATAAMAFVFIGLLLSVLFVLSWVSFLGLFFALLDFVVAIIIAAFDTAIEDSRIKQLSFSPTDKYQTDPKGPIQ